MLSLLFDALSDFIAEILALQDCSVTTALGLVGARLTLCPALVAVCELVPCRNKLDPAAFW